jgi:anti-sigma factor RsiW
MNDTNQRLSADDIEALLPWYAAGTLGAREAEQVEAALAADAELARRLDLVREEMAEAIVLNEALGVPSARVAENLFRAIDEERRTARASGGGLTGWLAGALSPRTYAFAAGAAALLNAGGVQCAADDVVADAGQILHAATAHEHNGVLLKIVTLVGDVGDDLGAVGEANLGDLADGGVGLLGGARHDLDANAAAEGVARKRGRLGFRGDLAASLANELVDCRHIEKVVCEKKVVSGKFGKGAEPTGHPKLRKKILEKKNTMPKTGMAHPCFQHLEIAPKTALRNLR